MTARLPTLKAKDLIRVLRKLGFYEVRQKGSHLCFKHSDGRFTLVPYHSGEDIDRGLLRKILKEIAVSYEEFSKILD